MRGCFPCNPFMNPDGKVPGCEASLYPEEAA